MRCQINNNKREFARRVPYLVLVVMELHKYGHQQDIKVLPYEWGRLNFVIGLN